MTNQRRIVEHDPKWEPAQLQIDATGNTAPGFVCEDQRHTAACIAGERV